MVTYNFIRFEDIGNEFILLIGLAQQIIKDLYNFDFVRVLGFTEKTSIVQQGVGQLAPALVEHITYHLPWNHVQGEQQ